MSISNQLRQPFHKDDLIEVIKQGLFMAFVGGLLIGSLQVFIAYQFNFSLTWLMLIVLASLTARRIKQSVYEHHIIFSFISVLSFILAFYLMNITTNIGLIYLLTGTLKLSAIVEVLNPWFFFSFLNPFSVGFFDVNNIIDIVFFIISIYYAYKYSK
ncbi:MAG: hypothetical protein K8Q99_01615 [Acholeplasmataceae bacterium]|nr:hypothetical protein [Acholeplasmataceae bacterium]